MLCSERRTPQLSIQCIIAFLPSPLEAVIKGCTSNKIIGDVLIPVKNPVGFKIFFLQKIIDKFESTFKNKSEISFKATGFSAQEKKKFFHVDQD